MIYYLSNKGNDNNNGISINYPFKTIKKINSVIKKGDTILIECNSVYNHKLKTDIGCNVNSYGAGDIPIFDFLINLVNNDIIDEIDDIISIPLNDISNFNGYVETNTIDNVGFIKVNGVMYANKKMNINELQNKFDFFSNNNTLYIKCKKNDINNISFVTRQTMMDIYDNMSINNIKFMNNGGNALSFSCKNITINGCEFENIGGSKLDLDGKRFGNGVEIWTYGSNIEVTNCKFKNIYDAATTIQGSNDSNKEYNYENIKIKNNKIEECGQSFEIWVKGNENSSIRNCMFTNNMCIKNAKGVLSKTRPNYWVNCHILFYETNLHNEKINIKIKNNIFEIDEYPIYFFRVNPQYECVDNNLIIGYKESVLKNDEEFTILNKDEFINKYGYDKNSSFILKSSDDDIFSFINNLFINNLKQAILLNNTKSISNKTVVNDTIIIEEVKTNEECFKKIATIKTQNKNAKCTIILNYSLVDDEVLCGDSGVLKIHVAIGSVDNENKSGMFFSSYFKNKYLNKNECFQMTYKVEGEEVIYNIYYKANSKIYAKLKLKVIDIFTSRENIDFYLINDETIPSLNDKGQIIQSEFIL